MRTIAKKQELPHRQALSGLVVVAILVAVAGAMAFALTGGIQDNLDTMTGSNRIAITTINAYTAGDRLVITGNIQNIGSQPLTSVTIDEITAGDLVITQSNAIADGQIVSPHGQMELLGRQGDGSPTAFGVGDYRPTSANTANNQVKWKANDDIIAFNTTSPSPSIDGGASVSVSGLTVGDASGHSPETISAGSSKSFRIVVTGISSGTNPGVLDILQTVPASTQLFMTVAATDGQTSTISDPRSVRVTAR